MPYADAVALAKEHAAAYSRNADDFDDLSFDIGDGHPRYHYLIDAVEQAADAARNAADAYNKAARVPADSAQELVDAVFAEANAQGETADSAAEWVDELMDDLAVSKSAANDVNLLLGGLLIGWWMS